MCKGWHSSIGDAPLTIINKYSNKLIIILSIKKIKNNSICVKGYLHYISLCYVHHHHHFGRFWGGRSKKPLAAKTDDPKKQAPFLFIYFPSLSLSLNQSFSSSLKSVTQSFCSSIIHHSLHNPLNYLPTILI